MTRDELRDAMADAIKYERDTRPYPLADAVLAALAAAGLVIGDRATLTLDDMESIPFESKDAPLTDAFSSLGLALVRVVAE